MNWDGAANALRRFPGASLPHARLPHDRRNIRRMVDRNYVQSCQRAKEKAEKLYGQQLRRAPGGEGRSGAYDLGAALSQP
jgi:hypothetical protein